MTNRTYINNATTQTEVPFFQPNYPPAIPIHESNWAVIDMQNVYKGLNWKANWKNFREYMKENFSVSKAIVFMGFLNGNIPFYRCLEKAGFELEFRQVRFLKDGTIDGGNCDADLTTYTMDHKAEFSKVLLVADDSDYLSMIRSLKRQNKLKLIVSPHSVKNTSEFIKAEVGKELILSMNSIRDLIEYK